MATHDQSLRAFGTMTAKLETDWNAVYQRELPRIYNYFRYRFGDNAMAEDLTSATFEKAWRARDKYRRDVSAFSTWLFTIARNVATDFLRAHKTDLSLDTLRAMPVSDSLYENFARQVELARLGALLAHLQDSERELIALKYGAQLNNREIARQVGMSESNVGTTLHRIVTKLRERWKE